MCVRKVVDSDGFITIVKKKRKKIERVAPKKIDREETVDILKKIIGSFADRGNIESVFLYGSVSKNLHGPHSDIDLMFVFNRYVPSTMNVLKSMICKTFSRDVDMVCMLNKGRFVDHDTKNINFIENVMIEGIHVYGRTTTKDIMLMSVIDTKIK